MKKLLFVGAGAVGSYIGAFLSRAGHDVTFVDPWAEQVDAINARGIAVTGPHDPFTARPKAVHVHEAAGLHADFDVSFVTMKSYDTVWAAPLAARHLGPKGYVVSAQNCWNDPLVATLVGADRAVGLVMSKIGVALWKPGEVERGAERGSASGHDVFRAGEHDGRVSARVKELAGMLSVACEPSMTERISASSFTRGVTRPSCSPARKTSWPDDEPRSAPRSTSPGFHSATPIFDITRPTARCGPAMEATTGSFQQFCAETT